MTVKQKRKTIKIRASSVGACRRKLWYGLRDGWPALEPEVIDIFFNGKALHDALKKIIDQHAMPDTVWEAADDKRWVKRVAEVDGWRIILTGTPDLLARYRDAARFIVDFKGLSDTNMSELESGSELANRYAKQCDAYCLLTGACGWLLVGRSKEKGNMKCVVNEPDLTGLLTWLKTLPAVLTSLHPPNRDFGMNGTFCRWCSYREKCWKFQPRANTAQRLTEKQASTVEHILTSYRRVARRLSDWTTRLEALKRRLRNLHDQAGMRTMKIAGQGYSQIRSSEWEHIVVPPKLLEQFEKEMLHAGKAVVKAGTRDSHYVVLTKASVDSSS